MSILSDARNRIARRSIEILEDELAELEGRFDAIARDNDTLRSAAAVDSAGSFRPGMTVAAAFDSAGSFRPGMTVDALHNLIDLIQSNQKIAAIKLLRTIYNLPLKESKDLVDLMMSSGFRPIA